MDVEGPSHTEDIWRTGRAHGSATEAGGDGLVELHPLLFATCCRTAPNDINSTFDVEAFRLYDLPA